MDKNANIYIAGHKGMVGSALVRKLEEKGYANLTLYDRAQLDLTNQSEVDQFFKTQNIEYVFIAAAKVGGIQANSAFPAQFIYENLTIQNNIIHSAYKAGVKRLLFLGSSCIYPKLCSQPMKEGDLLSGLLEPTNEPYAIAKIAGIKMCESYNRQYGTQFVAVMPTNLYGPNDNFDLDTSHVLPALIRKFHEAKISNKDKVVVWGTGKPKREFLHVNDMAEACLFVMNLDDQTLKNELLNYPKPCFFNVGTGVECSIKELATLIKGIVDCKADIEYDTEKPDGMPRKLLDVSRLSEVGWKASIGLKEGVRDTYKWYLQAISK